MAIVVEDVGAVVECGRVVGIERDRLVGVDKRLVELADAAIGVGALTERPFVLWIERDGASEIGERKFGLVNGPIGGAAIDQRRGLRLRLVVERVDQRAAGGDALLRRIGRLVGRGADIGVGAGLGPRGGRG